MVTKSVRYSHAQAQPMVDVFVRFPDEDEAWRALREGNSFSFPFLWIDPS